MSNLPPMPPTPPNEPQGPHFGQRQPYPGQPYPGQPYPGQPYPGNFSVPPQHPGDRPSQTTMLVWSIITTLLCCPPLGIAAIIQSVKIDSSWNEGRFEDARTAKKKAKNFIIASVALGALAVIVQIVVAVASSAGTM